MILTPKSKMRSHADEVSDLQRVAAGAPSQRGNTFIAKQPLETSEVDRRFMGGLRSSARPQSAAPAYYGADQPPAGAYKPAVGEDLSFKTGKARVAGVSSFVPLAGSSAAPAQRVVGKRFVQRPQSAAPPFAAGYASQAAGIVLGTEYGGRAHAEKRHAVPQPAEKPDQDVAVRHTFQSHSHNSHPIQERDPIGQHGYVGVEVSKSFGGEDHTSLRKQFEATKEKPRHANPMTMTMTSTSEPLQPRPMRKPGAPIADNLRTATGMAPLRDYSESKQRELKHVQHREWQSGETKALLSNSYAGPQASPTKLFDSRRERMDSERRNLIVHYSLPDWRTDIFESNQRLQLRGSEVLNKGYLYERSQAD